MDWEQDASEGPWQPSMLNAGMIAVVDEKLAHFVEQERTEYTIDELMERVDNPPRGTADRAGTRRIEGEITKLGGCRGKNGFAP